MSFSRRSGHNTAQQDDSKDNIKDGSTDNTHTLPHYPCLTGTWLSATSLEATVLSQTAPPTKSWVRVVAETDSVVSPTPARYWTRRPALPWRPGSMHCKVEHLLHPILEGFIPVIEAGDCNGCTAFCRELTASLKSQLKFKQWQIKM